MTPQDYLKYAVDSLEGREPWIVESKLNELQKETLYLRRAGTYAVVGILEHLIGTPEPERPVYDEHPKGGPSSTQQAADARGVELGKAYAESTGMTAQVLADMGINPGATAETLGLDTDEPVKVWELDDTAKPILITVNLDGKLIDQKIATAQDGLIQTITDAINATNPPESKTRSEVRDEYENPKVSPTPSGLFTHMANGVGPEHASAAELGKKYADNIVAGGSEVLDAGNFAKAAPERCTRMPKGWKCVRPATHRDGCFAYRVEDESDQVSHASNFELGLISGVVQAQNVVQSVVESVLKRVLEKSKDDESETDEDVEGEK